MASSPKPNLIQRKLVDARKLLLEITQLLNHNHIPYHLEGGALLGIVRDKELIPWDNDIDISVPGEVAHRIPELRFELLLKGYKLSIRKSKIGMGPINIGQYSLFKIKPLFPYLLKIFVPSYETVIMDIFVKSKDCNHTYWQAKDSVMRVENKYYESKEELSYQGSMLNTPNHYCEYLTLKYGDWKIPVKNWDCSKDEKTIVNKPKS